MHSKHRLDVKDFGRRLILSNDLDPVYVALDRMSLSRPKLAKWLIAYWCYYHCGVASYMSDIEDNHEYWVAMMVAAENQTPAPTGGRWPRGAERRHFRALQATMPVGELMKRYPEPTLMLDILTAGHPAVPEGQPLPFETPFKRAQLHRGFGPWISFKVCDMLERLGLAQISFDNSAIFMFKDPAKAAEMVWEKYVGPVAQSKYSEVERRNNVVATLIKHFTEVEGLLAPPHRERPVNIQEVETVLCKWKSHCNGHYPLGKDIHEIREGLLEWGLHSETAESMYCQLEEMRVAAVENKLWEM